MNFLKLTTILLFTIFAFSESRAAQQYEYEEWAPDGDGKFWYDPSKHHIKPNEYDDNEKVHHIEITDLGSDKGNPSENIKWTKIGSGNFKKFVKDTQTGNWLPAQ